jgi:predicted RNA-binding protein with PUA-like domain
MNKRCPTFTNAFWQVFETPLVRPEIKTTTAARANESHADDFIARNLMRDMKKGDYAFFYHSNCKTPAVVGAMEIVQEHSPDGSSLRPVIYLEKNPTLTNTVSFYQRPHSTRSTLTTIRSRSATYPSG